MFCKKCGKQIDDDAIFCKYCGAKLAEVKIDEPVEQIEKEETEKAPNKRKEVFDGEIHKCPNCGEVLDAFVSKCPSCGYELRGKKGGANSVEELAEKLEKAKDDDRRRDLISNFYVPNTKEDIIEFFTLAVSQIDDEKNSCAEAWRTKLEQTLIKAKLSFGDTSDYEYLLKLYADVKKTVRKEETLRFIKNNMSWLAIALVLVLGFLFIVIGCMLSNGDLDGSPYTWCVWVGGILAYCGVMALMLYAGYRSDKKDKNVKKATHKSTTSAKNSNKSKTRTSNGPESGNSNKQEFKEFGTEIEDIFDDIFN